jgi:DNA-binding Xre family transcriptional regulator
MYAVPSRTPEIAAAQTSWEWLTKEQRGEWIVAAMRARGISAAELGRRLDLTPQTMSAWTTGKTKDLDWARWMAVCLALDLPQTWRPGDPVSAVIGREMAKRP